MCCGPATLLWFALSVFRVADKIGIDGHVSLSSTTTKKKKKNLGIPLSTDPDAAARTLYTAILQRLDRRIARWSGFRLSLLGRAHVAKQVLVSVFTYHGTFVPVPADILRQLCTSLNPKP